MTQTTDPDTLAPFGQPAPVVRLFGWSMLGLLAAFLINNVLVVGFDYPTPGAGLAAGDMRSWISIGLYVVALAAAGLWVRQSGNVSLRYEARQINRFNAYIIRGCFFSVLFVGLADVAIAFLRVEDLLGAFLPDDTVKDLLRSQYLGTHVHMPLIALGFVVALFGRTLGFQWLALLIVAAELLIVISRFVFSYEQALMGDLVRYWYAALFLFASAYTLLEEGHVRVDVLYAGFGPRLRGRVNAIGAVMLGIVTSWCILLVGLGSKQSIINAPIRSFEISQTGTAGMYVKYQMAAFLAVFAVTMLIQFVVYLFEAVADARDEPGHKDHAGVSH